MAFSLKRKGGVFLSEHLAMWPMIEVGWMTSNFDANLSYTILQRSYPDSPTNGWLRYVSLEISVEVRGRYRSTTTSVHSSRCRLGSLSSDRMANILPKHISPLATR